ERPRRCAGRRPPLDLAPKLRPGVASRARPGRGLPPDCGKVGIERPVSPVCHASACLPDGDQAHDQVPARAGRKEVRGAVGGAEPHRDAVAELELCPLAQPGAGADGTGRLLPERLSLVVAPGHTRIVATHVAPVARRLSDLCARPVPALSQLATRDVANWPLPEAAPLTPPRGPPSFLGAASPGPPAAGRRFAAVPSSESRHPRRRLGTRARRRGSRAPRRPERDPAWGAELADGYGGAVARRAPVGGAGAQHEGVLAALGEADPQLVGPGAGGLARAE